MCLALDEDQELIWECLTDLIETLRRCSLKEKLWVGCLDQLEVKLVQFDVRVIALNRGLVVVVSAEKQLYNVLKDLYILIVLMVNLDSRTDQLQQYGQQMNVPVITLALGNYLSGQKNDEL